jgi:hypothetical protein
VPLTITRQTIRKRHGYRVSVADQVIARDLYGITTILGVLDKGGLVPWAARGASDAMKAALRDAIESLNGDTSSRALIENITQLLSVDTAPRIAAEYDLPRSVRARDCDCVYPVRAPDPEIRPAYPSYASRKSGRLVT